MEDKKEFDKLQEIFCLVQKLEQKIIKVERELQNVQAANVSQTMIIDRAILNVGKLINEIVGVIK